MDSESLETITNEENAVTAADCPLVNNDPALSSWKLIFMMLFQEMNSYLIFRNKTYKDIILAFGN